MGGVSGLLTCMIVLSIASYARKVTVSFAIFSVESMPGRPDIDMDQCIELRVDAQVLSMGLWVH